MYVTLQKAIELDNSIISSHAYAYNKYKQVEDMQEPLDENASKTQIVIAMEKFCEALAQLGDKDPKYWVLYPIEEFSTTTQIEFLIHNKEFYYAPEDNSNQANATI